MFSRETRIVKNENWYGKIAIEYYKLSKRIDKYVI